MQRSRFQPTESEAPGWRRVWGEGSTRLGAGMRRVRLGAPLDIQLMMISRCQNADARVLGCLSRVCLHKSPTAVLVIMLNRSMQISNRTIVCEAGC